MVGSYFSMKWPDTNCTVSADLPTPPEPSTTTLNSRMAVADHVVVAKDFLVFLSFFMDLVVLVDLLVDVVPILGTSDMRLPAHASGAADAFLTSMPFDGVEATPTSVAARVAPAAPLSDAGSDGTGIRQRPSWRFTVLHSRKDHSFVRGICRRLSVCLCDCVGQDERRLLGRSPRLHWEARD